MIRALRTLLARRRLHYPSLGPAPIDTNWDVKIVKSFTKGAATLGGLGAGLYWGKGTMRVAAASMADEPSHSPVSSSPFVVVPTLPKLDNSKGPLFSPDDTTVVFVLGGPGVGKGTQCAKLVADYDFVHLSAGDLLREERQRPDSPYGELIEHYIREGKIVPYEITISLLRDAMLHHLSGASTLSPRSRRFLIDGFPRSIEQGVEFETVVCPSQLVLFFECDEEVMLKRLLGRGQNSGRSDDNIESIRKRFRTYHDSTIPVRQFYGDLGKLRTVECAGPVDQVYGLTKEALNDILDDKLHQ